MTVRAPHSPDDSPHGETARARGTADRAEAARVDSGPVSDAALVKRAKGGDEPAYAELVDRHTPAMLRLTRLYTDDEVLAEDAVQDAWIGFVRGLPRFEGRSSVRTWLFRILLNRLRTRLQREHRTIPFSLLKITPEAEPAVPLSRFLEADHPRWPFHWRTPPCRWGDDPEQRLIAAETRALIDRSIAMLPPAQREVITLRDIEGCDAREVCEGLRISAANQRVLLHRARSRVRADLERYFARDREYNDDAT